MNPVVITGLGAVTPLGNDAPATWAGLLAGRSGVGAVTRFAAGELPVRIAGEVRGFALDPAVDPREARRMDRYAHYAINAALEAVRAAGLDMAREDSARVGVIFGTAAGGLELLLDQQALLAAKGSRRVAPLLLPNMACDAAAGQIAILLGARGPNMAVVAACATGGQAIGEAYETIRRGDADVVVAGGSEAPILPLVLASFANMRGLASDNEHPPRACKPFDARRDGFVLAEGAAALVLESLGHARARGAPIVAELAGYGSSSDAYHMAAPDEAGAGIAQAMRAALRKAGLAPAAVDYLNAHGTGTPINDLVETRAIKAVFGEHAYRLAISSTKSMLGHMMGAAGAVEALICALAIRDGRIPPTINLAQPDPACDLDYTPGSARTCQVNVAASNAIGVGGHNCCLVLRHMQS